MKIQLEIFFLLIVVVSLYVVFQIDFESRPEILVENSGPYVGVNLPAKSGYEGEGIKIAVIDTGVDHLHPDLFGFGPDGKIISGYNFVEEGKMPVDTNGHGTEVAGIIAADGQLKGIAPKSSIVSYKVSEDGESVSADLIVKALEQAIKDKVDVINISLGVNKTNPQIDEMVSKAIENGIVVITAAGNDGPKPRTIGSPGINEKSITVGATYNNVSSSLVATLEVDDKQFQVLPMIGTQPLKSPIMGEIVFGKFGRESDLINATFEDTIILVERGSDVEDEVVYFSEKEKNAAGAGAKAVLIYNNQPGIFFGELMHEFNESDYFPRIPALSLSYEDGIFLKELIQNKTKATLNVFYHPDFVAYFSSRGPVSPFYSKPDLVAPGVFVNSTLNGGRYNVASGTSFATPHVTGAVALLLEKNPNLSPNEIKSLLVTTTDFVSDAYGNRFPLEAAGAGRLNITRAFEADLIILPHFLTFNLTPSKQSHTQTLQLKSISDEINEIQVVVDSPDELIIDYNQQNEFLHVTASPKTESFGDFQGMLILYNNEIEYHVPFIAHVTEATIMTLDNNGKLEFEIDNPAGWSYAKISVINKETGKIDTTSATPTKDAYVMVSDKGEYWIMAQINANGETVSVYDIIDVQKVSNDIKFDVQNYFFIPPKSLLIILVISGIVVLVGFVIKKY